METINRIYFDNAATTPLDPLVLEEMLPYFQIHFGNPSSIYSYGREAKLGIEKARKKVAELLHCSPGEIIFTSGGTESINTAIHSAVKDLHIKRVITTKIEHHATMHTIETFKIEDQIKVQYLTLDQKGQINYDELESLLKNSAEKTLVCLMHANNEIGNLLKVKKVSDLCLEYQALFFCDTVQTVGHYPLDLTQVHIDFITGACHKFHGPKGVGILYKNRNISYAPLIHGGAQERNNRAGTENIYGIVGFAKALELAMNNYTVHQEHIFSLKKYCYEQIQQHFPYISFNGTILENNLYTILNFNIPADKHNDTLVINLDLHNICVSAGSACSSGAKSHSHVIEAIQPNFTGNPLRVSFSHYNTFEEVDRFITVLKQILA